MSLEDFYSCNVFNAQWLSLKDYSLVFYELLLFNLIDKQTKNQGKTQNSYKGHMDKTKLGWNQRRKSGWVAWQGLVGVNGDSCTWKTIKKKKAFYSFGIRSV